PAHGRAVRGPRRADQARHAGRAPEDLGGRVRAARGKRRAQDGRLRDALDRRSDRARRPRRRAERAARADQGPGRHRRDLRAPARRRRGALERSVRGAVRAHLARASHRDRRVSAPARNASASVVSSWARPSRRTVERGLSILSPLVLLAIWEAGAIVGVVDTRFFPAPSTIFAALATLLQAGELQEHLLISLERIAAGFVLGAVPGIVLGLAIGLLPLVRAIVQPLVDATFPIPQIALLPMVLMLVGIGDGSEYAINGIGYLIWNSWNTFQVDRMYAGLMVIALLGFASALLLAALERALVPWRSAVRI